MLLDERPSQGCARYMKRKSRVIPLEGIHRCQFSTDLIKAVDNRLDTVYNEHGRKVPFGDFRRTWWREHCQVMGGPDGCPYLPRDCALAFLQAAQLCVEARKPGAMFRTVARDHAMKRLERKPLARETESRSPFSRSDSASVGAAASGRDQPRHDAGLRTPTAWDSMDNMEPERNTLRRPITRPVRIGSLLGAHNPRPREVPADDREEGSR